MSVDFTGLDKAWNELAYLKRQMDFIDLSTLTPHDVEQFTTLSHITGCYALLVIELGAEGVDLSGSLGAEEILLLIHTHCQDAGTAIELWLQRAEGSLRLRVPVR